MNICKNWTQWLLETRFASMTPEMRQQTLNWLQIVRDNILVRANIKPNQTIIDIGTGTGLLAFKVLEDLKGTGEIIFSDKFQDCLDNCENILKQNDVKSGYRLIQCPAENIPLEDNSIDTALMRSVLVHIKDKQTAINEIYRILKPKGHFCAFEPIIRSNTRYWELTSPEKIRNYEKFKQAENEFMTSEEDSLCNFDEYTLAKNFEDAGFTDGTVDCDVIPSNYTATDKMVEEWFATPPSPGMPTMKDRFLNYFDEETVCNYIEDVKKELNGKFISVNTRSVYINVIK
jgi:ubiquinone/menaquinone biosynthesis C-methylase UbiE